MSLDPDNTVSRARCGPGAGKHVRCSPRPGRRTCCQRRDSPPLSRLGTLRPDQTCKYTAPAPAPHQRLMHDYSSPCAHVCISVHSCIVWCSGGRGVGLLYTDTGAVNIVETQVPSLCVAVWLWWAEWSTAWKGLCLFTA